MISETKRKLLTKALGECWHDWENEAYHYPKYIGSRMFMSAICKKCGEDLTEQFGDFHRTFSTAADWELVRVNVVVPNLNAFCAYAAHIVKSPIPYGDIVVAFEWFLTLSPEECCNIAADFILTNLDLFPEDVQEKIREIRIIEAGLDAIKKTAEKFPPESSQIISGKRMPWERSE